MSRTIRLALLATTAATATLGASCVENDQSVFITGFLAIDQTLMCDVSGTQTLVQTQGTVDTGLLQLLSNSPGFDQVGYIAAPRIKNNLLPTMTATAIERNHIKVEGFEVELQPSPGKALPPVPNLSSRYRLNYAVGNVEPGAIAFGKIDLIPLNTLLAAAASLGNPAWDGVLVARTRAVGKHAGVDFQSAWFDFPVRLCNGCLSDPKQACPIGGYDKAQIQSGCIIGQDSPITCCTQGNYLTCGTAVPTATSGADAGT